MRTVKENQEKAKNIVKKLVKHQLTFEILSYFSSKNIGTMQVERLIGIEENIRFQKYVTGMDLLIDIREVLRNLLCFVSKHSKIYLNIISIIGYFEEISTGIDCFLLSENCEIKEEITINSDTQNCLEIKKEPEANTIIERNISETSEIITINEENLPENINQPTRNPKKIVQKKNLKVKVPKKTVEKELSIIERRKLSKKIKKLDKDALLEVFQIFSEYVCIDNGFIEINVDVLPSQICRSLIRILNRKKTPLRNARIHRRVNNEIPIERKEEIMQINEVAVGENFNQDTGVCLVSVDTPDENSMPSYFYVVN